jgi:hypothetical protein
LYPWSHWLAALLLVAAACGRVDKADPIAPSDGGFIDEHCVPETCGCEDDNACGGTTTPYCDRMTRACVVCQPPSTGCRPGEWCHSVAGEWRCETACSSNDDCLRLGAGGLCCAGQCVNPATNPSNCGGCGAACPLGVCVGGHCVLGCDGPGREDCDNNMLNGCETLIDNDPRNCGKCGNVCEPFLNGLPTCTNGTCAAVCAPGYGDCNGNVTDGCEINTTIDVHHCGHCGSVCPSPAHAAAACDLGTCSFRCDLNFGDCDGRDVNGCETDVTASPIHCGHCGNVCGPGQSCIASRCQ